MPASDLGVRAFVLFQYFIALVLLLSGSAKLTTARRFVWTVADFRLVPFWAARVIAYLLPPLEILIAVALICDRAVSYAIGTAALLFAVFGFALSINLMRARIHFDCGCFGSALPYEKAQLRWSLVWRNVALFLASAFLYVSEYFDHPVLYRSPELRISSLGYSALVLILYNTYALGARLRRVTQSLGTGTIELQDD